ncbi:MAG TPA: alpha-hydroxy acid oxidase [Jatrophihabitans sp.]|jgi:isopentenyl diphosphate isomerase/L-lactate dehydrogenase-like FMN-dependent dehydrogenase
MRRRPILSVDIAQQRARRKVPRSVYAFIEGGTQGEYTVRANRVAFDEVTFRPRAGIFTSERSLSTSVLGCDLSMPVVLAPAGLVRLAHRGAEVLAAKVAGDLGLATGVSTLASSPIEAVTAATTGPVWYQVYFAGGKRGAEIAIDRAREAGCRALLVTLDSAVQSRREKLAAGRGVPSRVSLRTALQWAPETLVRPKWLWDYMQDGFRLEVPNVRSAPDGPPLSAAEASASMRQAAPTWADLEWIRERFGGPIAAKGILSAEDARRAVDHGASAVIVSNHGGNALDGTPATLRVLPEIVEAVGDVTEVLMDGGIRRPGDIAKALALGARAVLIGRAYIWALAGGGEQGLRELLGELHEGLDGVLALLGCESVHDLDPSYVSLPRSWS